jgi:hypothetical protein
MCNQKTMDIGDHVNKLKEIKEICIPPVLTFKNSTYCSLCVENFVRVSE